ncbi:MAG: hypothetical protein K0R54_5777 [Clostridiaceae bacterium]|nr:hypothetical protein [Clostridiaceae bacterium]
MQIIPPLQTEKLAFTPNAETGGGSRLPNGTGNKQYTMKSKGINLLKAIELPESYSWLMEKDFSGSITGIYPYYVGDRGITIGYGHYVGYNEVQGPNKSQSEIELLKEFGLSEVTVNVKHNKLPYKVPESNAIPIKRINEVLDSDISIHAKAINNYLSENKISVTQNEFDALVIYRFLNSNLGDKITSLLESGNRNKDEWYNAIVGGTKGDSQYDHGWREREKSIYNVFADGIYSYQGVEIK